MPIPERRHFNQAYSDARKNQQLEFEWNGKIYNTKSQEEDPREWLETMYHDRIFPTLSDDIHNSIVRTKLNSLDFFTPIDSRGLSAKNAYLLQLNNNLSPEYQLTMRDINNWDPSGIKTRKFTELFPTSTPDISILNPNQLHNWLVNADKKYHPHNSYPLSMEKFAQWDPDGSKSKKMLSGENPEGLHELYGKDRLHHELVAHLNEHLNKSDPEFARLFQYTPEQLSQYDPDGSIIAKYWLYGQPPSEDEITPWDKARIAELESWEKEYNDALARGKSAQIVEDDAWRDRQLDEHWNDESTEYARSVLSRSAQNRADTVDDYINASPKALKWKTLNSLDPAGDILREYDQGVELSRSIPLTMLTLLYGGSAFLKGVSKLDRFATRNMLKAGSKFLNYSKAPKLVNGISRYGILNGMADTAFLSSAIHNYATNPNASWTDIAWGVAPFALMTSPVRKGLSWIGNTVSKGWKNPYIKSTILTGAGIGTGIGINNLYQHTIKPSMNNRQRMLNTMQNNYLKPVQSNSSPLTKQYLSIPKTTELPELKFKSNNKILNSNK